MAHYQDKLTKKVTPSQTFKLKEITTSCSKNLSTLKNLMHKNHFKSKIVNSLKSQEPSPEIITCISESNLKWSKKKFSWKTQKFFLDLSEQAQRLPESNGSRPTYKVKSWKKIDIKPNVLLIT